MWRRTYCRQFTGASGTLTKGVGLGKYSIIDVTSGNLTTNGATSGGDIRRIKLVRNGSVVQNRVDPGASLINVNVRSQDQIFIDRRPWIDRNSALLGSAAISAVTLVLSVLLR